MINSDSLILKLKLKVKITLISGRTAKLFILSKFYLSLGDSIISLPIPETVITSKGF